MSELSPLTPKSIAVPSNLGIPGSLKTVVPRAVPQRHSAEHVIAGIPIPKAHRVKLFSPEEWEAFIEQWASCHEPRYGSVVRFSGAGDLGVDIGGFLSGENWDDGWDTYQCKQYKDPLSPSMVWVEIGKIIYYSFTNEYPVPRKHYFVAPLGIGTTLARLLKNPAELKEGTRQAWDQHCRDKITKTASIPLTDNLLKWFEAFNFSIFSSRTLNELIEGHARSPFHAITFGGGLSPRPPVTSPPEDIDASESRYIQQLFEVYGERTGVPVVATTALSRRFQNHFVRQREWFYHAESLRNFARDTVPPGTFERLQKEIFDGVIETCENDHKDGFERLSATLSTAACIALTSNPLSSVVEASDRQGMCHQLANEDRLTWIHKEHCDDDSL